MHIRVCIDGEEACVVNTKWDNVGHLLGMLSESIQTIVHNGEYRKLKEPKMLIDIRTNVPEGGE